MARNAAQTRLRILTAAGNFFSRHGYCGTSLEDILTAAAITKGAFYHHFKSKEEISSALLDQALAHLTEVSQQLPSTNPYESLKTWANRILDPNSDLGSGFQIVLRLTDEITFFSGQIQDKIHRYWLDHLSFLERLLASFPASERRLSDTQQAAKLIIAVLAGTTLLSRSNLKELQTTPILETAFQLIFA